MILTLWIALLTLTFGVCILGYFTDDEPYLTVGLTFLFLLSIVIITGTLQFENGEKIVTTFSYNATVLLNQTATNTTTYTSWNDTTSHIVGYLLACLSGIGIALSLMNQKQKGLDQKKQRDEE